jgi:type I restriction enzyme S subunit
MGLSAGYKQTEAGVIPEDWLATPLNEIALIHHGFGFQSRYFKERGPYRLTTPGNFHEDGGFRELGTNQKFYEGPPPTGYILQVDDLIVAMTEQADGLLGSAAMVPSGEYLHNQRLGRVEVVSAEVFPKFLYRVFNSRYYRTRVRQTAAGTKVKHTSPAKLLEIWVPLPPTRAEQEAIAEALSDADALIESLEQLLAKKRRFKQGAMRELLSGQVRLPGFNCARASTQTTMFGKVPNDWTPTRLDTISAFITKGSTPTTYGFGWQNAGVLFLRSECVSERGLDLSQSMFIGEEAHQSLQRSEVHSGDLLLTITGNVGRVVLLRDGFGVANINQHIARIRIVRDQVAPSFVFHFLSLPAVRKHYMLITTGQAYPQISLRQVRETEVPLPSLREQIAISCILSDMDTEIASLEAKLSKARQLKQGMMQELLTGRIRLV